MPKRKIDTVSHEAVMAEKLRNPEFRFHYEQRRMVHELALAVRGMRKNAGLTQAQLAKKIGASQPMIARIERGIGQTRPSWTTLHKIMVALGGQMKLSFFSHADATALVEVDGKPAAELETDAAAGLQKGPRPKHRSRAHPSQSPT